MNKNTKLQVEKAELEKAIAALSARKAPIGYLCKRLAAVKKALAA